MFGKLSTPEKVFNKYFLPWYKVKINELKIKPDMFTIAKAGTNIEDLNSLSPEEIDKTKKQIEIMINAAEQDWSNYLKFEKPIGLTAIHEFDNYYSEKVIHYLMKRSKSDDFSNEFIVTCCEFGVIIGKVLTELNSEMRWYYSKPYWDSMIYHQKTGYMIPVFSWAINKFSNYGVDDGYVAKIMKCLEIINEGGNKVS